MQVYRAEEVDAARFVRILIEQGIRAETERYPPNAWYIVVAADDPMTIAELARSAGRTVRRVPSLQELAAKSDQP